MMVMTKEALIRELDLDAVAAQVPADTLEPSQQEPSRQQCTPSSSEQTPTPIHEAHSQGGEREVHVTNIQN